MRAEDQIHKPVTLLQLLHDLRLLHHAAAQSDHHMRILLLDSAELSKTSVYSLVRVLAHRTRIVDDEIRLLLVRLFYVTDLLQDSNQFLRITRIHLTAESGNAKSQRPSCRFTHFLQIFPGSLYKIILPLRF